MKVGKHGRHGGVGGVGDIAISHILEAATLSMIFYGPFLRMGWIDNII